MRLLYMIFVPLMIIATTAQVQRKEEEASLRVCHLHIAIFTTSLTLVFLLCRFWVIDELVHSSCSTAVLLAADVLHPVEVASAAGGKAEDVDSRSVLDGCEGCIAREEDEGLHEKNIKDLLVIAHTLLCCDLRTHIFDIVGF